MINLMQIRLPFTLISTHIDPWLYLAAVIMIGCFFVFQLLCAFLGKRKRTRFAPFITLGGFLAITILILMPALETSPIGMILLAAGPLILIGLIGCGLAWAVFGIAMLIRKLAFKKA